MKNPFEKNDHKVLIAGIAIGTVAAGAAAYLFLTETGSGIRKQLGGHLTRLKTAFMGGEQPAEEPHPADYLKKPHKAPKTDREALKRHEILHETTEHGNNDQQE